MIEKLNSIKIQTPYWNDLCKKISSLSLWLTEIGYANLDLIAWSDNILNKSWFSSELIQSKNINWFKTSNLLSEFFSKLNNQDTTTASKKIKLSPTYPQRRMFNQWIGTSRFVYNKTLDYILKLPKVPNWMSIAKLMLNNLPEWANNTPYQIKKIAVEEACKNLSKEKFKCKTHHKTFKMHFRSKKQPQQSCYIPKSAILAKGIYPRIAGKLYYHETLPNEIKDGRLIQYNDKFYISIPCIKNITHSENQGRVVAIDPGIRKFITFVSHNQAGFIGKNDVGRIYRLCYYLDRLISKTKLSSKYKRPALRIASNRIREKIYNLINELHYKTANFITDNYDVILLPTFETQNMVSKEHRKINNKSARAMMTFSHYKFKTILKRKAFEKGKVVLDTNEAYTSQTNNFTGILNPNLGGAKYIKFGDKKIDRDINGALGVMLKALVDTPNLCKCLNEKITNCVVSES